MKRRIMLVVAVILNGTMVARAQTPEGRQACMNDAFQFCQEFIPDRERVFGCLVAHRNVISAACHAVMVPSLPVDAPPKKQHLQAKIAKARHGVPPAKSAKDKASVTKRNAKMSSKQVGGPLGLAPTKPGSPASR